MMIEAILVLAPLAGAFVAGVFQKVLGDRLAMGITTALVGLSAILSLLVFIDLIWGGGAPRTIELMRFIEIGAFQSSWSVRVDTLSAVMLVVVTSVAFLVHVYSIGYMAEDPHRARFFSYLSFFTFAMLSLVTANDLLQMFFGWEGVGVASYLLIGFWYQKRTANDAAIKAFVTNRVGDFGFALGIMATFHFLGTIQFFPTEAGDVALFSAEVGGRLVDGVLHNLSHMSLMVGQWSIPAAELTAILLFIGAMGKSAQFFLHVWLPDAMEGPTPVSALIHAATMVTAGVVMICRMSELFEMAPNAAAFVTLIGAVTAIFAATVGLAQNDIKRVIAYSTCSQLGYMVFAAGVGAYDAAMFHLFTHAFFKALLFLGAGSVIHGLHHEQDMRYMGGVRRAMQFTWAMMLIGTLALIGAGLPIEGLKIGFAGFYSKDAAIEAAYAAGEGGRAFGMFAFWIGVAAAFLTSFYSWRLMFMTFEGTFRPNPHPSHGHEDVRPGAASDADLGHGADQHGAHGVDHTPSDAGPAGGSGHGRDHRTGGGDGEGRAAPAGTAPAHESPWVMLGPLAVLAVGAVFAGWFFYPYFIGYKADAFWEGAIHRHHADHHFPIWVLWAPVAVTAAGFLLASVFYLLTKGMAERIARAAGPLNAFLAQKWYFDELYDAVFVKGARALGDLFWKGGDQKLIDGLGPNGVAKAARFGGRQLRRAQTGFLYHYSFLMLAAAVLLGAFAIWAGGGLELLGG
ncbi:MAG: NADH-quinone oxidoreductase subunit L [Alphaproteobacteria bacterium]|jgi:NADH-quinone oxidoreductase subunit L|nr:NADH-quinone oxidoreductase subunit L [Alphaproteobacteria bacterium]